MHAEVASCAQARWNKQRVQANGWLQHVLFACEVLCRVVLHLFTVLIKNSAAGPSTLPNISPGCDSF